MGTGAPSSPTNRITVQEMGAQGFGIDHTRISRIDNASAEQTNGLLRNPNYSLEYQPSQRIQNYGTNQGLNMGQNDWQDVSRNEAGPTAPPYVEEQGTDETIVFETFHCYDGKEYVVLSQGGTRFYLDSFERGDWQPLDSSMLTKGYILSNHDANLDSPGDIAAHLGTSTVATLVPVPSLIPYSKEQAIPGRDESIFHPLKGRIATRHVEERINIRYYYDKDEGVWARIPITFELYCTQVEHLVRQVQEMVPLITDEKEILSVLRYCNYNIDETVSTYLSNIDFFGEKMFKERSDSDDLSKLKNERDLLDKELKESEVRVKDLELSLKNLQKDHDDLIVKYENQNNALETVSTQMVSLVKKPRITSAETEKKKEQKNLQFVTELYNMKCQSEALRNDLVLIKEQIFRSNNAIKSQILECLGMSQKLKEGVNFQSLIISEIQELYQRESFERRQLYNQLQEVRGNIKVFCRCRRDSRGETIFKFQGEQDILYPASSEGSKAKVFRFDKVFPPKSSQEDVYSEVKPLITSTIDGYHVCILAYGQTGSGKTYTMMGSRENPGVNMRAVKDLIQSCQNKNNVNYKIRVSLLEVYNETLKDLLATEDLSAPLDIHVKGKHLFVRNLTDVMVSTYEDVIKIIDMGERSRSVAETKMNSSSSRSHLILIIKTFGTDCTTNEAINGSLILVDLAGSERLSKTEASGQRLVEAAAINKSLTSLGQVFTGLRTKTLHVPYRNSKLTHLLQSALSGDGKACLFVNVSPLEENLPESFNSLQFGSAARQIQLGKAAKT